MNVEGKKMKPALIQLIEVLENDSHEIIQQGAQQIKDALKIKCSFCGGHGHYYQECKTMKYFQNVAANLEYTQFRKHLKTIQHNRDMMDAKIEEAQFHGNLEQNDGEMK